MFNPIEINAAARKAAKLLGESGQVGRVEGKKYAVRIEPWHDEELFDFGTAEFYKVSDLTPTLAELDGGTLEVHYEGEAGEMTISADQFVKYNRDELYLHPEIGVCLATEDFDNYDGAHVTAGLYMTYDLLDEGSAYILTWGNETIHTIDPKFIPGAVLPVVELGTALLEFTSIEDFTEAEHAKLTEVAAMGLPVVIKDPTMSTVFNYMASEDSGAFWTAILSEEGSVVPIALYRSGDYWVVE